IMSEYKTIVLQQGLEDVAVDDYQFRKIKSLLRKELNLTKKMQNDYDRIQMADLLEDTFPKDAGLDKLIEVCQSIRDLEELAQRLKTERAKVQKKGKNKTAVKKRKQEEPSSSRSLSTDNELDMSKPSSEEMRKETIKTEGSKKMKLTQEQTQLPEPSGSNTQKDEGCLQTPQKPIPTPSSSSSNKVFRPSLVKRCTSSHIQKPSSKTQVSQKKHQLLELSATNNSSAVSELQTLQGLSATASRSIQAPQTPLKTCFTLKMPPGSAALSYQNFPVSLASNSNIHLNSPVPLTLSSGIQAPHVPSATPCSNVWILQMPSETVSSSFSAPQMAPVSVSSSAQNIHLPTAVAANSKQFPHSPQVITSRCVQSTGVPSAPLKVIKKPPTKQSSNVQVLHALPEAMSRNVCITQVPQITTSSSILTPNSATVKAHRNAKLPDLLEIGSAYSLASQVLLQATSNSLPAPQVSIPTVTSRVQTTQTHPGAASNVIQDLHAPPWTESRSVCTTQVPPGVSYGTGQALPCPKVKVSRRVHAPQMPSATMPSATASKNLLDSRVSPATAFSALQAPLRPPATRSSSPSRTPNNGNLPKEPSKVEGHHRDPKQVMVLKVTEPFTYDLINNKRMFHATVATETEFFRVKVFDTALKNKFIPQKIIAISDYFGVSGFLEIYGVSCVSDVNVNQTMVISNTLRRRANGTPKIKDLFSQTKGTYVNGRFVVTKKNERGDFIYYGIEDDTGKMEVVVSGPLTCIKCEPDNKVQLICFQLTSRGDTWQLKSVSHSYMQVLPEEKSLSPDSVMNTSLEPYF
uniref:Gamma-interferon-inducible protein 16-like n=1 Tax=Peromyscus maniculatus bairdii TaxID=230844 RepID=A0A8C8W4K0_PERMB